MARTSTTAEQIIRKTTNEIRDIIIAEIKAPTGNRNERLEFLLRRVADYAAARSIIEPAAICRADHAD